MCFGNRNITSLIEGARSPDVWKTIQSLKTKETNKTLNVIDLANYCKTLLTEDRTFGKNLMEKQEKILRYHQVSIT